MDQEIDLGKPSSEAKSDISIFNTLFDAKQALLDITKTNCLRAKEKAINSLKATDQSQS